MNDAKNAQREAVRVLRSMIDSDPEEKAKVNELQAQIRAIVEANGRLGRAALIFTMDELMTKVMT